MVMNVVTGRPATSRAQRTTDRDANPARTWAYPSRALHGNRVTLVNSPPGQASQLHYGTVGTGLLSALIWTRLTTAFTTEAPTPTPITTTLPPCTATGTTFTAGARSRAVAGTRWKASCAPNGSVDTGKASLPRGT